MSKAQKEEQKKAEELVFLLWCSISQIFFLQARQEQKRFNDRALARWNDCLRCLQTSYSVLKANPWLIIHVISSRFSANSLCVNDLGASVYSHLFGFTNWSAVHVCETQGRRRTGISLSASMLKCLFWSTGDVF
jgi:hypothetical protein